eukprot:COSAG02_NODE_8639_length_2495_cov_3.543406_2_plen_167_part_00
MSLVAEINAALRDGIVEAVGGGIAGCVTIPVCLPLELIMSFQAAGDMPGRPNMLQVAAHLYKSGGIRRFFKAPGAMAATIFSEKFCLFFWYSVLKAAYAHAVGMKATAVGPVVGIFCGWSDFMLSHSFEVLDYRCVSIHKTKCFPLRAEPVFQGSGESCYPISATV